MKFLRNISPDHMKYTPLPHFFWTSKRSGGGPPDARLYPRYVNWIYSSKKQTGHDFCELLLLVFEESSKILRNGILLLQWNLRGGASRAVKYNGFAPSPLKHFTTKILGREKNMKMLASAGLHVPGHIHRCPFMHN